MFDLTGKGALVTGASGGIGGAIAMALHAAGAHVALSGTRRQALEVLSGALGERAEVLPCDLSDAEAVAVLPAAADSALDGLDIVVNNAGLTSDMLVLRMKDEDWNRVLRINLTASFQLCRGALRGMMKRRWGRIINITSIVGVTGNPGQTNYAAAKAGIVGLTRSIAREAGRYGITTNALCPLAATRMTVNDAVIAGWKRRLDAGLLTQAQYENRMAMPGPEYVAPMVGYLCTEDSRDVNGQLFHAERSRIHTYYFGEEARSIFKHTEDGMFSVDELIETVPASLMEGIPNLAPAEEV